MIELKRDSLHLSVRDPVATSMNFLNEIAGQYPDAISLAAGRPHESFHSTADITRYLDAYQAHLARDGYGPDRIRTALLQYGRTNGQLGELIARMLLIDEGITVAPDAVAVTAGCQEAMAIALRGLCRDPEDVVLAAEPCYVGLTGAARLLGISVVPVPEGDGGLEPRAVAEVARKVRAGGRRPRALYVVPTFSNPSGTTLDRAARLELLEVAETEDLLILEDDPYGLFGLDDEPRPSLKALDRRGRVVYLGTFSKSCFPGARVGFLVADQTVIDNSGHRRTLADELSAVKSMLSVNTSPIAQAVIGGMLVASGCSLRRAAYDKTLLYRRNLRVLLEALDDEVPGSLRRDGAVAWNRPDGGYFVGLRVPFAADVRLLELSAQEYGVLWTPMSFFYESGGTHAIRLACSALDPDEIREGVRRLVRLIVGQLR
ncbi:PLP-dependent aminotransferase family protein [Winogradskya consettensis]|uniref:Aminotransferase n=1 Tax=Winogradskya consettensis TaxID=113560 RepID=A0A919T5G2_9ACTN|nr:PLP-dependent aminotransferase family protein [Actinoplanes consettensis]GIM85412.1 aminotransferase [Actinoplanes consettensis]